MVEASKVNEIGLRKWAEMVCSGHLSHEKSFSCQGSHGQHSMGASLLRSSSLESSIGLRSSFGG